MLMCEAMESKKDYEYGYQPLDEFVSGDADDHVQQKKLQESFEFEDPTHLINGEDQKGPAAGLTIFTAGLFIVGEVAGAGTVALPAAMSKAGYAGFFIILIVIFMSLYCGLLLGWSWNVVRKTRVSSDPIKDPFPAIGEMAIGLWARHAVTFCLNFQIFFTCVVYLLLSAEIVSTFISFHVGDIHSEANLRIWLVILAAIILPFTWLGSPKDFWFVALLAASTTAVAVVLIITKYIMIAPSKLSSVEKAPVSFMTLSSAFGTFVFAFTGASLFPTIQSDMKKPNHFARAVVVGYVGTCMLYVPTATGGFLVLGKNLESSILKTLANYDALHQLDRTIVSIVEFLFAGHFICGLVLMINPFTQQMEGFFKVPHKFCWQRVVLRSSLLLLVLGTAEAFPKFGPILDLVGGSVNVFLSFIFPIMFYWALHPETRHAEKILMVSIVVFAVLAALASTASNVNNIQKEFGHIYLTSRKTSNLTRHV